MLIALKIPCLLDGEWINPVPNIQNSGVKRSWNLKSVRFRAWQNHIRDCFYATLKDERKKIAFPDYPYREIIDYLNTPKREGKDGNQYNKPFGLTLPACWSFEAIKVIIQGKDRRLGDHDNIAKPIFDALFIQDNMAFFNCPITYEPAEPLLIKQPQIVLLIWLKRLEGK